ncbi:MAG TPA: hypothetical protein DCS97_05225 [Planctomycetes bacterium]|nr:hypothetical protein [Planctomycetota bacterium]
MSRWGIIGMVVVAGCATAAALLADHQVPSSRTVGVIPVPGQASLARPEGIPAGRRAWRMVLRLDPDLRQPGPSWALREGLDAGSGYELAWQPEALSLQLLRGGERPLILGGIRLEASPHEVILARRGARLAVSVDGREVIDALDPEGVPEPIGRAFPDGWSVATPSSLGASTFAVHDDGDLPAAFASDLAPGDLNALHSAIARGPADLDELHRGSGAVTVPSGLGWRPDPLPGRSDHALLRVRLALMAAGERQGDLAARRLGEAAHAVAALGSGHPDHARLMVWLAFAEARIVLNLAEPGDAERVRAPLDQLVVLAADFTVPEATGMLLALLPSIAEHAVRRPPGPRPLGEVLAERSAWLATLDSTARAVRRLLPAWSTPSTGWQLQFIAHACGALGGSTTVTDSGSPTILPTPAAAPEWLAARWRTLAGGDPGDAGLPPIPAGQTGFDPLLPVVEHLVRAAALEPLAALRLRAVLTEPGAPREVVQRRRDAAGGRFSALSDVIVALARLAQAEDGLPRETAVREAQAAAAELGDVGPQQDATGPGQPVHQDPLAFALACLVESRCKRSRNGFSDAPWSPPALSGRFSRLTPFAQLLSGDAQATELVWLHDDAVLPPAHALAVALAMREVRSAELRNRGDAALDWSLQGRLRSYTLPLELLDPRRTLPSAEPGRKAPASP